MFNDTDSFCHHIPTESDLYDDIRKQYWFDFSNYVEDHPNHDASNKLVPGKFKDEMGRKLIEEFVGLLQVMWGDGRPLFQHTSFPATPGCHR